MNTPLSNLQSGAPAIPPPPAFPHLEDSVKPDVYLQLTFWEEYGALVLVISVIVIALVIYFGFFFKRSRPIVILTPAEKCIEDIQNFLLRKPTLKDASITFSLILREYITGKTQDPALYETQEEFNQRVNSLKDLPSGLHEPTRDLLDKMARLKYEPYSPDNAEMVQQLSQETIQLINEIEHHQVKSIEETDLINKP